jgi:hypothetical protein
MPDLDSVNSAVDTVAQSVDLGRTILIGWFKYKVKIYIKLKQKIVLKI